MRLLDMDRSVTEGFNSPGYRIIRYKYKIFLIHARQEMVVRLQKLRLSLIDCLCPIMTWEHSCSTMLMTNGHGDDFSWEVASVLPDLQDIAECI